MTEASKRLIKYGFVKPENHKIWNGKTWKEVDALDSNTAEDIADEETMEVTRDAPAIPTGYPKPAHRYWVILESYQQSIEESYFWVIDHMRYNHSLTIDKITDVFAAAENSAFFGNIQQRIGLQQEKVSAFLATIGKMTKELFQIVRELRILDERLAIYNASLGHGTENRKQEEAAEITLKGYWIDLVEGGAKNPASVYGMSRELGFMTLPDLFFASPPMAPNKVDAYVDTLDFNRKIKEVLKRKLRMFTEWKHQTYKELNVRRKFVLKYLRQHYNVIKMYMAWVRPYLHNIKRLMLDKSKTSTPDMIVAFENSMLEIEIMGTRKVEGEYKAVILVTFLYRTKPSLNYQQEGYQRGPIHIGKIDIKFRAYAWTDEHIKNYKRMRESEDFEILGSIDDSVKAALEALGEELESYLKQAGEENVDIPKENSETKNVANSVKKAAEPFTSVVGGFGELFGSLIGYNPKASGNKTGKKPKPLTKKDLYRLSLDEAAAKDKAMTLMWRIYKIYKKAHKMLSF